MSPRLTFDILRQSLLKRGDVMKRAKLHSEWKAWWELIKRHPVITGVLVGAGIIALAIAGYWADWTGFDGYYQVTTARTISGLSTGTVVRTEVYQPVKYLW